MSEKSPKILLVDDEPLVAEGFRDILSNSGFEVFAFSCPEKVLESIKNNALPRVNCLILDLDMPKMTGVELYELLATDSHTPPVIFISGVIEQAQQGLDQIPNSAYLKKPFSYETLIETITAQIENTET